MRRPCSCRTTPAPPGAGPRTAGRRGADRHRAARAVLVGAVEAVEAVQQPVVARERRLVGDDVDRAGQRIGAVQQRAGAVDDLHAADRVGRDQADLRARAIRRLPRGVEPLAVHEHEQPRRIQPAQPRPHAERAVAHRRDVGNRRQRVTGRERVGLFDRCSRNGLDVQGNLPCLALGARGGDAHLGVEPAELELNRQVDHRFGSLNHDGPRRLGEPGLRDDDEIRARGRRVELKPTIHAGIRRGLLSRGHAAQHDMTLWQRGAGDIRHDAANTGGKTGAAVRTAAMNTDRP